MIDRFYPPHPVADPDRLDTLAAYDLQDLGADTGLNGIVLLARTLCGAPTSLVSLVDDEHQWFAARSGFAPAQTPICQSVCAHALEQPGLLVIPDLTADRRTWHNGLVTGDPHLRFYAGAPLRTASNHVLGTLCVLDTVPRAAGLSGQEAEGLQILAAQVMLQLEVRRQLVATQAELTALRAQLAEM